MNRQHIILGLRVGIPIGMGYMAVAFSLGIIAAKAGLSAPEGFVSSFFTRASGCAVGILAGSLLPQPMVIALSMSLYGMFLAIVIPPARQDRNVLYVLLACCVLITYLMI